MRPANGRTGLPVKSDVTGNPARPLVGAWPHPRRSHNGTATCGLTLRGIKSMFLECYFYLLHIVKIGKVFILLQSVTYLKVNVQHIIFV